VPALPNASQKRPICDPNCAHLLELGAIQAVEEGHNICLEDPPHLAPLRVPLQRTNGVVGAAPGPEAVRAFQQGLLVDGFEHLAYGVLDHLVLECREADRPRLALSLGDVDPSDGLMAVLLCLQPCVQILEGCLQILPILFLGDPIHPYRRIGTLTAIGSLEGRPINPMRQ
jgi:hypothetical protein